VAHHIQSAYPRIDPEQVIAWDPQVILVAHADAPGEAAKRLAGQIGWSNVSAVRQRRIIDDIDPDLLFRPGPRLVEGVKQLAERLTKLVPTLRVGTQ
jgi:iron complex transport system substrate-binding protein